MQNMIYELKCLFFQGSQSEGADRDLIYSDDEMEDFSSAEEGSDSEPLLDVELPSSSSAHAHGHRRFRAKGGAGGMSKASSARQRNLKQKFVALLKKFKVTDPDELEHEQVSLDQKLSGQY